MPHANRIPGYTSTGSKRAEALFGTSPTGALPLRMTRSAGCRVWDAEGREYVDYVMGLGSVALGYAHPAVTEAATRAVHDGVVGPLPPVLEGEVAERICGLMPWVERVRFLKTGAEAMAAAVRLARTVTGRERVLGCGYHGWLDWNQLTAEGVPAGTRALYAELPFNDVERGRAMIRAAGARLAAVVFEPIVVEEPTAEWLAMLREESRRAGAVLVVDEIKTVGRLAVGGGTERYGLAPDLVVMGKAIANGFPLAVVGGRAEVMEAARRTWISSTLATEFVALAAARATLEVLECERVPAHLWRVGGLLLEGLRALRERHPHLIAGVGGVAPMCFLQFASEGVSGLVAAGCAARGLLFKRSAYDFVSLAHDEAVVRETLATLDAVLAGTRPPV
ncbi:MAG TPA: aminotransferase class III-fold pyridoxal phosphate-dependent enzyme [Gemmatimonadales bacterium]|nr:aminotransferase class III-fold pyridoxal phosphate-dependent enzyme [Gemmatimonadales bacterium]